MFLDSILNEGMNMTSYDLEPIVKSHYEGIPGMMSIIRESEQNFMQLERAVYQVDILTEGCLLKNDTSKAEILQEGVVGDFFGKVVQYLKSLWQKLLGWFKNLFTGIETRTRDIVKVIEKYKSVFKNADFDEFEYEGFKWNESNVKTSATIATNAATKIKNQRSIAEKAKQLSSKGEANKEASSKKTDGHAEFMSDRSDAMSSISLEKINGMIYAGKGEEMSSTEIATEIRENTQGSQSSEKIKGFSATSPSQMIEFIKSFKSNKVLTDSQTNTNKILKEAIDAVSKIQKDVQQTKNGYTTGQDGHSNNSFYLKCVKNAASNCKNISSSYSTIMAVCIDLEQSKFNEYKKVIAAAIRYGSKKSGKSK